MMSKKPTDYDQTIYCAKCGKEISSDTVYINRNDIFAPHCEECHASLALDDEGEDLPDEDWYSMETWEYLDEQNDRAYDAYVDRCIDEARGK